MAINKVIYGGNTLIDLTSDSVTEEALYSGEKAHDKSGAQIVGTNPYNAANVDPAVDSILAALTEKGVDTTGAGLADIAALVAGIQNGGGEGEVSNGPATLLATGTITPSEDISSIKKGSSINDTPLEIVHNIGKIPKAVFLYHKSGTQSSSALVAYAEIHKGTDNSYSKSDIILTRKASSNYYNASGANLSSAKIFQWTEDTVYLGHNNSSTTLKAGCTYEWFVYG